MRRVLLLVCLIVSVVELDWERERIYLLSSVASLLLVLYRELLRRRKVQKPIERAFKKEHDVLTSEASASDLLPFDRARHIESGTPSAAIEEVAIMQNNSG